MDSKANGMYKRHYLFRMNIMKEFSEIRRAVQKYWQMISKLGNGKSSSFRR